MASNTILVTGANGQLGQELQALAPKFPGFEFVFSDRSDLSIDQPVEVQEKFKKTKPSFCINCAAYTAVDKAESEKELAFRINGKAVGILAQACAEHNTRLIHLSTDYVFDGNASRPLREDEPTAPVNAYGASKLMGEQLAIAGNKETIILRTAWVYSAFGSNFVKTMIRLMNEKESVRVINDQIGTPTYGADLAGLILQIIISGKFIPGIYHYSNEGRISWYEFALAIREMTGSSCEIIPISSDQYPTPAKRPHFSLLDKTKIKTIYSVEIPDWKNSLDLCIRKIRSKV